MKLLNQSLKYLSASILLIISLWAVFFYFNMLDEIKESVDEGLENYKRQIIYRAQTDSSILEKPQFDESFFTVNEISKTRALGFKDRYVDTLIYMQDADDETPELEPVRMLATAFESNGNYYELTIVNSMVEEDDLMEELFWEVIWLYVFLIGGIVLINNFVLKRLWKPFYDLLFQLKGYRLGNSKGLPQVKTDTREFVDLQSAINILLQQNVATYEQQKQFIGNASHELQTPLAVLTGKLELLLEKGSLENEQAECIAQSLEIIERLTRLNKSLLLLTKIENKQFFDNQNVVINQIVEKQITELGEFAEFKKATVSVDAATELTVVMDPALANTIISNMIKNAIFHNTENGKMSIRIAKYSVSISNTSDIAPLDAEKIFSRFYKSETDTNGTGLGLAIVKAVCNLYDFKIAYQFTDGEHQFIINFAKH